MGRHKKVSDQEMILGARECFLRHGTQVSTAVIAECVGVSQSAIFKRFPTKEDLMVAALAPPALPEWIDVIEQGPDGRPFREQLEEAVGLLNDHMEMVFPRIHLLHAAGVDPRRVFEDPKHPPIVFLVQILSAWFRRAQKRGMVRQGNAKSMALMMMGAIHSRAFIRHITKGDVMKISSKTHNHNIVDNLLSGILPEGGGK